MGSLGLRWLTVARASAPVRDARPGEPWHLLLVAYYYPPQNEIGAARPHRFARWLRRSGLGVTVVTSAPSAVGIETDGVAVIQTPGPAATPRPVRVRAALVNFLERLAMPYDDRLVWLPHAIRAACAEIRPGTVVLSTHPPIVTHLVALALKQRCGIPWIADFRDPLWGNPHRTSQRAAWLNPLVERFTVEQADAVIANTEASAEMLRRRYPALHSKFHVVWNGFDPDDVIAPVPLQPRTRRVIAHVGTLYGDRTLRPLLLSLERLIRRGELEPEHFELRQVGRVDTTRLDPARLDPDGPCLAALAAKGCLVTIDRNLPRLDAVAEMVGADWLLLLDMNLQNPGLQVPAKLYEYVRAGRPILALTVPGSSTETVLAMSGVPHACLYLHVSPHVFDAELLAFLRTPIVSAKPSEAFAAAFAAPNQVRQLVEIIERTRSSSGATPLDEGRRSGSPPANEAANQS